LTIELPVPTLEDRARFLTPLKRFTVFAATSTAQALADASSYYSTFPKVELTSLADRIAYPPTVVIGENAEVVGEMLRQAGREIVTTIEPFDNPRYRKSRILLAFASAIRWCHN
jgi:hypothetical protein